MKRSLALAISSLVIASLVLALIVRPTAIAETMNDTWCWAGFVPGTGADKTQQDACAANPGKRAKWHFHGFIKRAGKCWACWDEEDSTCESKPLPPPHGFDYLGGSCNDTPVGDPSVGGTYVGAPTPPPKQPDPPQLPVPDPAATTIAPPPVAPPVVVAPPPIIKLPPPPLPKPTDYDGVISKVSPGPYAVNTPIRVEGQVKGTVDGKPRKVLLGDFVVIGPDGKEIQRVHGTRKNGVFFANLTIAVGGNVKIRFEPKSVQVFGEVARTWNPAEQPLTLAGCRVEGKLDAPMPGEVVVADAPTALKGHFVDAGGKPIAPAGATAFFLVEVAGKEAKLPATLDANGAATGTVTVPRPQTASEDVRVRLVVEGGPGDICPSGPVDAKVTALGVGIEIKPDKQCYKDRPCAITARFKLPNDPKARVTGLAFVTAKDMKLTARAGGAPGALSTGNVGDAAAEWKGTITPGDAGDVSFQISAVGNGGWKVDDQNSFTVLEPIELALTGPLDFGSVPAGTAANKRCTDLSFEKSRGALYQRFKLTATKPKGCDSYPTFYNGDIGYSLVDAQGVDVEILDARKVTICLAGVPRCSGETPEPSLLTVQALSPDFPDQKATLEVKWQVTGRNPLACWWWLIAAIGGSLFVIIVGYGFIKPFRFNVDDQVQLAGKREQLARAVGRRLRDLPGGRSGWYKSASVGLLENGQASAKVATGIVELHARKGEVMIKSRGGLERVSHQTKKLEPVPEAATKEGHCASKNTVYAAGNLFFQIK